MADQGVERRLAADVAGYSRLVVRANQGIA
jgi:hypothetical protein